MFSLNIAFGFKKYGASKMLGSDLKMGCCKKNPGQVSDFSTMAAIASWSHPPGATGAAHNSHCSLGRRLSLAERLANGARSECLLLPVTKR